MPPKAKPDPTAARLAKERLREAVLGLHLAGGSSINQIAVQCGVAKATAQSIIKTYMNRPTVAAKKSTGRPPLITKRSSYYFITENNIFFVFRYKRMLARLSYKHPFWGCGKLADHLHEDMVQGLSQLPAGAVYTVCCLNITKITLIYFIRSHLSQRQERWQECCTTWGWVASEHCINPYCPACI